MAFDFNKLPELQTGIPGQNVKTPGFDFNALPTTTPQPTTAEEKPGIVKSIVQDIARPVLKTIVSPFAAVKGGAQLAAGDKAGAKETLTKNYDFGYFGKVQPLGANVDYSATPGKQFVQAAKESIGTGLEVGSNLVGGEGAASVGKSLLKSQLKNAVIRGAKSGAQFGALGAAGRSLQNNDTLGGTALETAVGAGVGALAGAGLGVAGVGAKALMTPLSTVTQKIAPALERMGAGIEKTVIRPLERDYKQGFVAENVLKHDLGGTLRETIEKSTAKLKQLRLEAQALRSGATESIDLSKIVQDTAADVLKNRVGSFGVNKRMESALADFVKEMEYISPNGKLTVPQAQEVKEALGTFGSWLYGNRDLDATAQERVANIMYSKIKRAIEKNTPGELQGINKQMSEIIPIKNAAIRRLPVSERNNTIGLGDIISAGVALQNPSGWGLLIANQLQKSGRFAGQLFKTASKLRAGAAKIESKINGLRITPQSLITRNNALRGGVKAEEKNIIPKITTKKSAPVIKSLKIIKDKPLPLNGVIDKMPAKKAVEEIKPNLRTKTSIEEINFPKAKKLSPEDRLVEQKAIRKYVKNKDKLINEYLSKNGKVANTDEARKLFASSGYKGYNSAAVQEPASALNKDVFRKMLKDNPEPYVTIYAGGSGSGKSTAVGTQKRIKNIMDKSAAILDGNLSSIKSAIDRISEANAAGKKIKFVYVYRDPLDAFENGVISRMKRNKGEAGRIVPIKVTAGNHRDSLEVIKQLYQDAPQKNKADFKFIDNSFGLGKSKIVSFADISKKKMPNNLEEEMKKIVKKLYDAGEITKIQYKKYLE